jgi:hypothetical protein
LSFSVLFKSSPLRGGFFIFSSIGEVVKKLWHTDKEFNSTPHFYSLPRGEKEGKKMILTAPLTFILSRKGREGRKENDFNGTSHFNYFSLGEKGKES